MRRMQQYYIEIVRVSKIICIFVAGFVSIAISIVFIQKRTLELIIEANDVDEKSQKAKVNIKSLIFNKKVYEDDMRKIESGCCLGGRLKLFERNIWLKKLK